MGENGHGVRGVATDLKHARRLEDLAFKGDHFAFIGQAFFFEAEQHPPCGRAARSPVSSKHRGCAPFLHCSTRIALGGALLRLFAFASFLPHYCRVESGYYYFAKHRKAIVYNDR